MANSLSRSLSFTDTEHTHTHTHTTVGYYSALRKDEILQFATMWMDLEAVMLSEISHTKTHTISYHLYVDSRNYNKLMNVEKRNRLTDTQNKLCICGREGKYSSRERYEQICIK